MIRGKACRSCRHIMDIGSKEKECPLCNSSAFTTFWRGYVVIVDPEKSEIAQKMNVTKTGRFALRLSR